MKIQCSSCKVAEAKVLCCADESVLCLTCDEKIHSVNKLHKNHARLSLSHSTTPTPKCDICQETTCYFFCLEHRALLCRKCDSTAHGANSYVSSHRRLLLTGVTVPLQATEYQTPFSRQHFTVVADKDGVEPCPFITNEDDPPVPFAPDMGQQSFVGFPPWASDQCLGSTSKYVNQ